MRVGRRMTRNPKTVAPDDSLGRAADLMRENRINHLPVVEAGKLVGILSDTDLRNAALTTQLSQGVGALGERPVREVMRTEVWSLTPEDSLEDALLVITRQKFGALPVLAGDRLVGIITKIDLLRAFASVLDVNEACLCLDIAFPKSLARFEELIAALSGMGIAVQSCIVAPRGEIGSVVAHLRLDALDGPAVRKALKARGFAVAEEAGGL